MSASIFFGQLIGIYLFVTSIAFLVNQSTYKKAVNGILKNIAFIVLTGSFSLIMGSIIIITHNLWIFSWEISITIIGYLTFLKGLMILFFPNHLSTSIKILKEKYDLDVIDNMKWMNWFFAFVGAFLIYMSFIAID